MNRFEVRSNGNGLRCYIWDTNHNKRVDTFGTTEDAQAACDIMNREHAQTLNQVEMFT